MNPATETVVATTKMAMVIDHLKNNRIEYLVLVLFSHVLGLTSKAQEHVAGVCWLWLGKKERLSKKEIELFVIFTRTVENQLRN